VSSIYCADIAVTGKCFFDPWYIFVDDDIQEMSLTWLITITPTLAIINDFHMLSQVLISYNILLGCLATDHPLQVEFHQS